MFFFLSKKCWEKCNDCFKHEIKTVGGGKWLFEWESLVLYSTDSFKRIYSETKQVTTVLWMGYWIIYSLDSFSNETPLCCSKTLNSSAVALIGASFISEIEQNSQYCWLKVT